MYLGRTAIPTSCQPADLHLHPRSRPSTPISCGTPVCRPWSLLWEHVFDHSGVTGSARGHRRRAGRWAGRRRCAGGGDAGDGGDPPAGPGHRSAAGGGDRQGGPGRRGQGRAGVGVPVHVGVVAADVSDAPRAGRRARDGRPAAAPPAGHGEAVRGGRVGVCAHRGGLPRRDGSVEDVARAGGHLRRVLDPDGSDKDDERGFDRRWLSIADLLDGASHIEGILDPELAARFKAALDPLAQPADADDPRTREQRYADALDTLIRGGQQTHMSVIVDLEALTGGTTPGLLPGGQAISAADARRIAENAGLSRLLVGPGSLPLDVGREARLVTPALRRALEHRDRSCVVDGCDIPAHLCEADHVIPWVLGGNTSLANTVLCCGFHHKWKTRHPDRIHITRHDDGRITYHIPRPGHWPP
ncbi:MAG: DUF222 domain-containing protein [Streptosporangiales bacterium]|nr:DUF222 domain-containing protein [Streptosporangiales bacterium]